MPLMDVRFAGSTHNVHGTPLSAVHPPIVPHQSLGHKMGLAMRIRAKINLVRRHYGVAVIEEERVSFRECTRGPALKVDTCNAGKRTAPAESPSSATDIPGCPERRWGHVSRLLVTTRPGSRDMFRKHTLKEDHAARNGAHPGASGFDCLVFYPTIENAG